MARSNKYTSLNFNDIYEKKGTNNNSTNNKFISSSTTSSARSPSSYLAASRLTNGGMLVLSRPSPKPQHVSTTPPLSPSPKQPPVQPVPTAVECADNDAISLRPQGKTGGGANLSPSTPGMAMGSPNIVAKSDKFVPPHLRPGYVLKDVVSPPPVLDNNRPKSGGFRTGSANGYNQEHERPKSGGGYYGSPDNFRPGSGHGYHGSPNHYGAPGHYGSPNRCMENGRPKSGGGYDRRMGAGAGGGGGGGGGGRDSDFVDLNRPRSSARRPGSSG